MVFGWFKPKSPIGVWMKAWVETRMVWLAAQFGIERLRRAKVILPTEEFFPGDYRGTPADAQDLLGRVCGYMGVNRRSLRLEIRADEKMPGAAGQYEPGTIRIAESQLREPIALVATLAHELAHDVLLGGGHLTRTEPDGEWVTDLLPVYLGLGLFAANATVQETHERVGNLSWWSVGKQGYLTSQVYGYALALFAFMRGETRVPSWGECLRPDALESLRDSLHFLDKTDDTLFHPDTIRFCDRPRSVRESLRQLRTGSPSARIAALWELAKAGPDAEESVNDICRCLLDRERDIRAEAAETLGAIGPAARAAVPALVDALKDRHDAARQAAARALGRLGDQPDVVVPELSGLLDDGESDVVQAAAEALTAFGSAAATALPHMLAALKNALIECDDTDVFMAALQAIVPDAEQQIRRFFSTADPELQHQMQAILFDEE
jgi:hypothetical protein